MTNYVHQGTLDQHYLIFLLVTRDSGIESTLSKFADDTRLCGAADTVEERDAMQGDLDRLEKLDYVNIMKFSKAKCNILYLCQGNPKHRYCLGRE